MGWRLQKEVEEEKPRLTAERGERGKRGERGERGERRGRGEREGREQRT